MKYLIFISLILIIGFLHCTDRGNVASLKILTSCQDLDSVIKNKGSDITALTVNLVQAFEISKNYPHRRHDSLIAVACRLKGISLANLGRYSDARFYYEKGLQIGCRHLSKTEDIIVRHYRNIGVTYFNSADYQNALRYYDSVQIVRTDESSLNMKVDNLSQSAACYQKLKDRQSSEKMALAACILAETFYSKAKLATLYINYASILRDSRKYSTSIKNAEKAIGILEPLAKENKLTKGDTSILANAYFSIGFALKDSGLFVQAFSYYNRAIILFKKVDHLDNQITGLMNLGNAYRLNKQYDKAEQTIQEALTLLDQTPNLSDFLKVRKGELYVGLNEIFMDKKEHYKALIVQDSAIVHLTRYNESANLNNLLQTHRYNLLAIYADQARVYLEQSEKGIHTEGYQKTLNITQKLIELADDIRADYFSDEAKLTLANDIKPALEKAIGLCQKLYAQTQNKQYLEQAFGFVEYSRSMVLYENARLENQLSSDLKAENEALKRLERDLIGNNDVEKLQNYLRLKRQFREKIKALNHNKLASVSELQAALIKDDKTAFIEFFVGDSTIFVFTLLQNKVKLVELNKGKDFEKQIENLRNEVIKKEPSKDATAFAQQSNRLYNDLLKNSIDPLPKTVKQLIIAPDGALHYVPFDILVTTPPSVNAKDFKDSKVSKTASKDSSFIVHNSSLKKDLSFKRCDFLLDSFVISSAYSANLLLEQKRPKEETNKALFGGFAPKYEENDPRFTKASDTRTEETRGSSGDLKWAREEVITINSLMNGKAYLNDTATEATFKHEANHYRILHLAMHGMVNDKDPALSKLLFRLMPQDATNDSDLTAAELYTMPLNADLTVMSACNTGLGALSKGEGVMNLARAFTYAGVPATVTSLWPAHDRTTNTIMVEFYKNLKQGMTKDSALTMAKRKYLKTTIRSIEANPFFWGTFVPMGNMEAIDMTEKGPLSIWAVLAAVVGLGGLGFWYWKRKG